MARKQWYAGAKNDPLNTKGDVMAEGFNDIAPKVILPSQKLVCGLGDSIMYGVNSFQNTFVHVACSLSNGEYSYRQNAGVPGDTSAQILARVGDILPEIDTVFLLCSANDAFQGVSNAEHTANVVSIVNAIRAAGHEVIAIAGGPLDNSSKANTVVRYNEIDYVTYRKLGVKVLDPFKVVTGGALGEFLPGYTSDGTHPNTECEQVVGAETWRQINNNSFAYLPITINTRGTIANSNFMLDDGAPIPEPALFGYDGEVTTASFLQVAGVVGRQLNATMSNTFSSIRSDRFTLNNTDLYMLMVTYEHNVTAGAPQISLYWEDDLGGRTRLVETTSGATYNVSKRTFVTFYEQPTGALNLRVRCKVENGAGGWSVDVKMSEVQIFNLTSLGWG